MNLEGLDAQTIKALFGDPAMMQQWRDQQNAERKAKRRTKPRCNIPIDEWSDHLTRFDKIALQQRLKAKSWADVDPEYAQQAAVWIYDNRDRQGMSWDEVMSMTWREVEDYYADSTDEDDEFTDEGKA